MRRQTITNKPKKGIILPEGSLAVKGSYILVIELTDEQTIALSRPPNIRFSGRYYASFVSALGTFILDKRLYSKGARRPHWHIDYLLAKASISDIILAETTERVECTIAQSLKRQLEAIPGFGASDCKCGSHLFFTTDERQMKSTIMATLDGLGIPLRLIEALN